MKKSLLVSFILIFTAISVHAYAPNNKLSKSSNDSDIKFGIQLGGNVLSGKAGGFFEYKFMESLGVQTGLLFFHNKYWLGDAEEALGQANNLSLTHVATKYIALPLTVKWYPGVGKQFSLFTGMQLGYLVGGEKFDLSKNIDEIKDVNALKEIYKEIEAATKDKITSVDNHAKFDVHIMAGLDYEFSFGLRLGLFYTKGLIDVLKSKVSAGNFTLQPTIGYNIAKLIL